MRLPGTCSRYSKNAMPQLTSAATYQGRAARFFKCAYQAKVMKTFDAVSNRVAEMTGFMDRVLQTEQMRTFMTAPAAEGYRGLECGRKAAEVVAVARPRPRGIPKNPR